MFLLPFFKSFWHLEGFSSNMRAASFDDYSQKTSLKSCLASVWELSLSKSTFQAQTHFCRSIDFQSFHSTLDILETWEGHKRVKLRYYDIIVRMNIGEMETHFLNDMIPQNFCWFAHQQILVQEWIEGNSCTCWYKNVKPGLISHQFMQSV